MLFGSTLCASLINVTGILVRAAIISFSVLPCSGERCTMTTYAIPLSDGILAKNSCSALTPPADAPIPITRKSFLSDLSEDVFPEGFGSDFEDFLFLIIRVYPSFDIFFAAVLIDGL